MARNIWYSLDVSLPNDGATCWILIRDWETRGFGFPLFAQYFSSSPIHPGGGWSIAAATHYVVIPNSVEEVLAWREAEPPPPPNGIKRKLAKIQEVK